MIPNMPSPGPATAALPLHSIPASLTTAAAAREAAVAAKENDKAARAAAKEDAAQKYQDEVSMMKRGRSHVHCNRSLRETEHPSNKILNLHPPCPTGPGRAHQPAV